MKSKKFVCVFMTVIFLAVIGTVGVSAASFSGSGKGTKSSPYLVTNAQQLDEMRNNLSAYYKLSNTIDMSGVANFKPIGNVAKPFTGTFICDTNSEGAPIYAIKNLTVNVSPEGATEAGGYSGYKKDGTSGWEAGLFGKAKGATFKNIVILNANITNNVEGRNSVNNDNKPNPGQSDEMGAAALVAIGDSVTVTGCGSTGNVTAACNNVGGLLGYMYNNCKVKNSYSYATVSSTGYWNSAGFAAVVEGTTESCFYNGTFKGGMSNAGAFIGAQGYKKGITVKNCWAGGIVKTPSSGCFGGTEVHDTQGFVNSCDYSEYCYTIAKIEGRKNAQTNKKVTNHNYITDEVGGFEMGFAAASIAEINAAFSGNSALNIVEGQYPQLKGVVPITDEAKYVVGTAVGQAAAGDANNAAGTDTASADTNSDATESNADTAIENGKSGDDVINTEFKSEVPKLGKAELILVIVLTVIIVLTLGFAVFVLILNMKYIYRTKKDNLEDGALNE